jgi:D-alanyl-D-alanine carboxypeptidase (penicillin-binding protein 5/6)
LTTPSDLGRRAGEPPTGLPRGLDVELRRRVERRRRRRRAQLRRRRLVATSAFVLLGFGGYATFGQGGGSASHDASSEQLLPPPRLTSMLATRTVVPGRMRGHLPWPATGQGAVAVLGSGLVARSPREREVPIASLTKMMTALVLLQDHPLALGEHGPVLRMTRADAATWVADSQAGDSTLPVRAGERLTEYQLLEGLLIPSGDNIATLLARWDAGSVAAFVKKMNAEARALGLDHTHYADASGLDPASRSTAADQAVLATQLMRDPVVRQIVVHPSLPFPVAGTIWNYNPALGTDGIIGVKSGFTGQAAGCLVTAAYRAIGGQAVLVVTAVLGQPLGLGEAAQADEALLSSSSASLVRYRLVPASGVIGVAHVPWSSSAVPVDAPELPSSVVAFPGTAVTTQVDPSPTAVTAASPERGVPLGSITVSSTGGLALDAAVDSASPLPAVPAGWALTGK